MACAIGNNFYDGYTITTPAGGASVRAFTCYRRLPGNYSYYAKKKILRPCLPYSMLTPVNITALHTHGELFLSPNSSQQIHENYHLTNCSAHICEQHQKVHFCINVDSWNNYVAKPII